MQGSSLYQTCSELRQWRTGLVVVGSMLLGACGGSTETAAPVTAAAPAVVAPPPVDVAAVLAEANAALGMAELSTITVSGSAWRVRNGYRQTLSASPPWPERDEITNYQRTIDLNAPASRATGETFAQNMFLLPATAGVYQQNIAATQTSWGQQLEIWLTPWGFLKGAGANGATASTATLDGESVTAVSWKSTQTSPAGLQYTVTGYIDDDGLIQQVETWVDDAFMGDLHVVNVYDNYQNLGGVMAPGTMEQLRGGGGIFGVTVTAAVANPPNAAELLTIPPPPAGGPGGGGGPPPAAPPAELSVMLSEGVYHLKTAYNSMLVEFADHVVAIEAGGSPAVGEQIVAEAARLFPTKPLRYLVNTHPHSDHTAGMVPVVRAGATIVTHQNNVDYLRMGLSSPRTLLGETTMSPQFVGAGSVHVMEDATRRLELHHIPNLHNDGTLVAYLPNERILMQADFTLPVGGAMANPFVINLAEYVDANGLQFDQYLAVHPAAVPQTMADLMATIGK